MRFQVFHIDIGRIFAAHQLIKTWLGHSTSRAGCEQQCKIFCLVHFFTLLIIFYSIFW